MFKSILTVIATLTLSVGVHASYTCDNFTEEQEQILKMAYVIGAPYDRGHTLAGIVWRESFVGRYVVRVNSKDGAYGSYGVGQMQLSTAMELTDVDSQWQARAHLAPLLMNDDIFALNMSMRLLLRNGTEERWFNSIVRYNGKGQVAIDYAKDVVERVNVLETCSLLDKAREQEFFINQMANGNNLK